MLMRIVEIKISQENLFAFRRLYDREVIPVLRQTPGCLGAKLVQNGRTADEFMSLTMWKEQKYVDHYVNSGRYAELIEKTKPMFADSAEWKIQLADDFTLEYKPVEQEPAVKSYKIVGRNDAPAIIPDSPSQVYMRVVSLKVGHGKQDAFKQVYRSEIIPALKKVPGCRYAFLLRGTRGDHESLSITIWDSKQDSENYDNSGLFEQLTAKLAHTLSSTYQWKMTLEKEYGRTAATTEDLKVDAFTVITGSTFNPKS
jgi:quinol monooxygenase YgiN